jgi:hypothetical protein
MKFQAGDYMIIFYLIAFMIFVIADIVPLYKGKQWKNFGIYMLLFILAVVLNVLVVFGVDIPSPTKTIENFTDLIFGKLIY